MNQEVKDSQVKSDFDQLAPNQVGKKIKIGILAFRGKNACLLQWSSTAKYLEQKIPEHRFEIVPLSLEEMEKSVRDKTIHFVLTNPGHYIILKMHHRLARIATMKSLSNITNNNVYGAVILSSAQNPKIKTLTDLRGKSFMTVGKKAFGGFQMAWLRLKKSGMDPFSDFSSLTFSGFPQDKIVFAIKEGKVDAGTVRTGLLEIMINNKLVKKSDFRILGERKHKGFHHLVSTDLYPEWPLARLQNTSEELSQKVVIALLGMKTDEKAAINADIRGWTVPLDYHSVHMLFRDLQIGSYAPNEASRLKAALQKYRNVIIFAIIALLVSLLWGLSTKRVVRKRTRELEDTNTKLTEQIEERKRLENELVLRQGEMMRMARLNSLGEMASSIAHELNHPLTTILNYVKGCQRRIQNRHCDLNDINNVLDQVVNQADHSASVIRSMMNFVRNEHNDKQDVELAHLVEESIRLVQLEAESKNISITFNKSPKKIFVHVDKVQIEQVILNLIRNALEAMSPNATDKSGTNHPFKSSNEQNVENSEKDGSNTLNISKEILVTIGKIENGHVEIIIKDKGPGMPEEMLPDIFEPFVTKKNGGLGLGLSISKTIMESHNGHLTIVETSCDGSQIAFTLPVVSISELRN